MIVFWVGSALLAVVALAVLLRPLYTRGRHRDVSGDSLNAAVYRDQIRELGADLAGGRLAQADYARAKAELERRLLDDVQDRPADGRRTRQAAPDAERRTQRGLLIFSAVAVPLLALGIYLGTGNPRALDPAAREGQGAQLAQIEAMVQGLADRLEQNPEDAEGWKMLAKSYAVLGRFPEAVRAYSKAIVRSPRDPQLLADFADALAMARGQRMKGEPEELVLRALQIDPNNLKALALAGTAAFERSDFRTAARYWERMLPLVPADSEDARTIRANVDEARAQSASKAPAKKEQAKKEPAKAVAGKPLQGVVSLSPTLAAKASPDDTVFIFARAAEGPPMPLAVLRKRVRDLPVKFSLDDSMAMTPTLKLSAFPRVVVGARISKSANATPQPGDLQWFSDAVGNTATGVSVSISSEVPRK
jgi:cytochrome c-type biogenesis protein CcmH